MSRSALRYMPALDGMRAFAVLAVLCYHGGFDWARGGFLGVDAFFVLSGFLITSLLLNEWNNSGRIDLKSFWIRRARRLLPALILVLLAVSLYAATMAASTELRQIRGDSFATLFYFANWHQIATSTSYFQQFSLPSPLQHTWSLAIEEQFYLLWPLLVYGFLSLRRRSRRLLGGDGGTAASRPIRPLVVFAVVGTMASVALMAVLYDPRHDPSRVYFGTDTRAQSLLVGALLAMLWLRYPSPRTLTGRTVLNVGAILAALALGYIWSTTDASSWLFRGGLFGTALLVAVVIASVVQPRPGLLGRFLSIRPLRVIGTISYGLYLWHWPVFIALSPSHVELDPTPLFLVRLAATFALATASYVLVERPIRHGTWRGWRVRIAAPAAVASVIVACLVVTAGAPPTPAEVTASDIHAPTGHTRAGPARPLRVMLVGDSVADSLAPGVADRAARNDFEFWNATVHGCGLANDVGEKWVTIWLEPDPRCFPSWRQRWTTGVAQWRPDVVVTLLGFNETYDYRINGQVYRFDTPEGQRLARKNLEEAVADLSSKGARVVLLTSPYYTPPYFFANDRHGFVYVDPNRAPVNPHWIDLWNKLQREVAAKTPGVTVLDLNKVLDPKGQWTDQVRGVPVRIDDRVHLSAEGAELAGGWLVPKLLKLEHPTG